MQQAARTVGTWEIEQGVGLTLRTCPQTWMFSSPCPINRPTNQSIKNQPIDQASKHASQPAIEQEVSKQSRSCRHFVASGDDAHLHVLHAAQDVRVLLFLVRNGHKLHLGPLALHLGQQLLQRQFLRCLRRDARHRVPVLAHLGVQQHLQREALAALQHRADLVKDFVPVALPAQGGCVCMWLCGHIWWARAAPQHCCHGLDH
eukprot:357281-Chlamydomonas_euryale.AAC.3